MVIGRLAPSPTGYLHLGHARTFLLAWWSARRQGGRIVLRIEDLDEVRARPEVIATTLEDLTWLGLDWDGPVELQSEGVARIQAAAEQLLAQGLAYACVCSRGEIRAAQSAPQQGDAEPRYPGTCRGRFASLDRAEAALGRPAGVRFAVPDEEVVVVDGIAGTVRHNVQHEVGDFLIARRDKAPAYQLAVVVDDARQGVTEVVRGDDLLPSAARQHLLQRALGFPHPRWRHVPLVVDGSGARLAKRRGDLSLAELRARGVDPRSIVGWAARSAGIPAPDRATAAELTPLFEWAKVPRAPVVLGPDELLALQQGR